MAHRIVGVVACLVLGVPWASSAQVGSLDAAPEPMGDAGVAPNADSTEALAPAAEVADADGGIVVDEPVVGADEAAEVVATGVYTDEPMIVTGSRIMRATSFAPAAAVDVLDRTQLERSGASNMADVIAGLSAAQGSGFQGAGDSTSVASGTASVNLRGLGTGATLVLINGRRMVPSGAGVSRVFADLSVMPLAAVERIEVLKGGGSAVYGADAVGGVINIITRRDWEGVRGELDVQSTTRWDQQDVTAAGAFGVRSERARATLSLSYFRRNALIADERAFTRGHTISQQGNPGTYIVPGLDPENPGRARFPDPGCAKAPGSAVQNVVVNGMETADQVCTFDFRAYWPLLGGLTRLNLFGSAEVDLTRHTAAFAEVLGSRMRSTGVASPSLVVPPPLLVVPADHVDNPFGRSTQFFGRPLGAASGPARNSVSDDTLRIAAGLKGDLERVAAGSFLESFSWELFASWGSSRYGQRIQDNLRAPLQDALNSCADRNDPSRCFNPFYSAIDGTGTPNSKAVIDDFTGQFTFDTEHTLATYNGGVNGFLFELPGGEVGVALGAEVRRERRVTDADHDAEQEHYGFLIGNVDEDAARRIYSGYLELFWPFYRGVELQTAVRVERYDDIDTATSSPFAGLTLTPASLLGRERVPAFLHRLTLRGSFTSAFRAPTVYQSSTGYAVIPTLLAQSNPPSSLFVPVQGFGNPSLDPERALIASTGVSFQPFDALTLSGEFWHYSYLNQIVSENPQQALANDETLAGSGQRDPRVVRDAMGNLERIQVRLINVDGKIVTRGVDFAALLTLTGATFGGPKERWGQLSLGAQGTYTLSYEIPRVQAGTRTLPNRSPPVSLPPLNCRGDRCDVAGSRNVKNFAPPIPRWRLAFPVTYTNAGHSGSIITRYVSKVADDNDVDPSGALGTVAAWVTLDLQYGYTLRRAQGRALSARIGVYNVFDRAPPRAAENAGFEPLLHDPRGRMVYGKLSGTF